MLLGRERECASLDALISRVAGGSGAAVVLEGEPGIGKTSLLDYAATQGHGLQVLRARGVESERNLPFAGLADLLRPVLGYLGELPAPQRDALAGALAVGPIVPADPFAVCAATLSLLGIAASRRPVLALADDVNWLDAESARAVGFAARRLDGEPVVLVAAARHAALREFDAARISKITVGRLDTAASEEVLASTGRSIAPAIARQLTAGAGGNPLALLQLPAALTVGQLRGVEPLPEPLPVGTALRQAFARRLDAVPAETRRLLLVAATAPTTLANLRRACEWLSLDLVSLPAAEEAGLIRVVEGEVEFTHPLLRAAVYYAAPRAERQAAHRALAGVSDPVRRAWHLAGAADGPDESVAVSLDQAAAAAQARNAFGAASSAYQRAAELTPDPAAQFPRWMAAGQAAHLCGNAASAVRMLRRAIALAADPLAQADAWMLLAQAAYFVARPMDIYRELVSAADMVLESDRERAAGLLGMASMMGIMTGQLSLAGEVAARGARLASASRETAWLICQSSLACTAILTGDRAAGREGVWQVLRHPGAMLPDPVVDLLRTRCGMALLWCEDHQSAVSVFRSTTDAARAAGRVADLPAGLAGLSEVHFRRGEWTQAYAYATEAVELGADVVNTQTFAGFPLTCLARIEAALGDERACRDHVARAIELHRPLGIAPIRLYASSAAGLLELGRGSYDRAAAELSQAAAFAAEFGLKDPCVVQWRPDYVESLSRLGRTAEARRQFGLLEAEAAATGSPWAAAVAERCRGLLEDKPQRAAALLADAVTLAENSASLFEQARTRLCLGQALNRARQQTGARQHLQLALSAFQSLGARSWAQRAAADLAAAGVTSMARREPIHARLTPQELRVALLVAEGLSNQEVATRLFVSHKTIEFHLGRIYDKLAVRSRAGLARIVHTGGFG